jgi:hypothetical protein
VTKEQRKALEDFARSDDESIPDIGNGLLPTLSTGELDELVEEQRRNDPSEDENIQSPQKILSQAEYLESVCQDIELMQFFVNHFVYKLWRSVFSEKNLYSFLARYAFVLYLKGAVE